MKPWVPALLGTVVLWGVAAFFRKLAVRSLAPSSILVFELIGGFIVAVFFLAWGGWHFEHNGRGAMFGVITGFLFAIGTILIYYALRQGPVSVITAVSALGVLITVVLGYFILHEQLHLRHIVGIVFGLVAAALLAF